MPYIEGFLIEGGVNNDLPRPPARPDNSLPGGGYVDNSLPGFSRPVDPGFDIPLPPVTIWPTPPRPPQVGYPLPPTYPVPPVYIDNTPPSPPSIWPVPPVPPTTWPPPQPIRPGVPVYPANPISPVGERPSTGPVPQPPGGIATHPIAPGGETPGQGLPMPPGSVWPPLPGVQGPVLCLVWVVGYGYRWTVIDPSLDTGMPLPNPPGGRVDNELPAHAQPR